MPVILTDPYWRVNFVVSYQICAVPGFMHPVYLLHLTPAM